MENRDLITAAISGDKNALSGLLMEYRGMVASVVARSVFETDNRRDVVQNVFVKAVNAISGFNGTCKFSTWLYRIAMNEVADYNRSLLRFKDNFKSTDSECDLFVDINSPDGLEQYTKKEISVSINASVNELPIDQKAAFSLFYFCGFSGKEAAASLNITEDNFFMRLKAARDKVRKRLIEKGWEI